MHFWRIHFIIIFVLYLVYIFCKIDLKKKKQRIILNRTNNRGIQLNRFYVFLHLWSAEVHPQFSVVLSHILHKFSGDYHSTFELSFYSMYYCDWHKNDFPPNAAWWEFSSCAINQCISWVFFSFQSKYISSVQMLWLVFLGGCKILYGLCGKSQKCSLFVNWNYKFVDIKRYCFKIICWNATSYCRILF